MSEIKFNNDTTIEFLGASSQYNGELVLKFYVADENEKPLIDTFCRDTDQIKNISVRMKSSDNTAEQVDEYIGYTVFKRKIDYGNGRIDVYMARPDIYAEIAEVKEMLQRILSGGAN